MIGRNSTCENLVRYPPNPTVTQTPVVVWVTVDRGRGVRGIGVYQECRDWGRNTICAILVRYPPNPTIT